MRFFLACIWCFAAAAGASAQTFLGKHAGVWVSELESAKEARQRRNAAYALGKLGEAATSHLNAIKKAYRAESNAAVQETLLYALGEIAARDGRLGADGDLIDMLGQSLRDPNALVRRSAAYALGNLRRDAVAALPALSDALSDPAPEVRQTVAWALGRIGDKALPLLKKALTDKDALVVRDAAGSVSLLPVETARGALPELLTVCKDGDSEMRRAAMSVLVKTVKSGDDTAVAPLRLALLDKDVEVRRNAALALSNLGAREAVASALPVLADALRHGDPEQRRLAAAAIRAAGPDAEKVLPELVKALSNSDSPTRGYAAFALGGIGAGAAKAVPDLVALVANAKEDSDNRFRAANALSSIGPGAEAVAAVPDLVKVLADRGQPIRVRERIVWALRVHGADLNKMLDAKNAFLTILDEPPLSDKEKAGVKTNKMLRFDCAYMIGRLDQSASPDKAIDMLGQWLDDPKTKIFLGAKATVGGVGAETPTGKATIKEEGERDGRFMAIDALNKIGAARLAKRRDILAKLAELAADARIDPMLKEEARKLHAAAAAGK